MVRLVKLFIWCILSYLSGASTLLLDYILSFYIRSYYFSIVILWVGMFAFWPFLLLLPCTLDYIGTLTTPFFLFFTYLLPVKMIRLAFASTHLIHGPFSLNTEVDSRVPCKRIFYHELLSFHIQQMVVVVAVVVVLADHTNVLLTVLMSESLKVCMFLPRLLSDRGLGFENGLCFGTSEKICPSDHAVHSSTNIFDRLIRTTWGKMQNNPPSRVKEKRYEVLVPAAYLMVSL